MATIAANQYDETERLEQEALATLAETNEQIIRCVVGYNTWRLRVARGMRQCDLLGKLVTTTSNASARSNGWKIENGRSSLTLHRIATIAAVLGVDWTELMVLPTKPDERAELDRRIAAAFAKRRGGQPDDDDDM